MAHLRSPARSRASAGSAHQGARFALAMVGVGLVAAVALGITEAQETKSVKAGVYTAEQSDRGVALFNKKCASCHAPNRFTDDLFYTSFAGKPMWEMFDVISDTMPEDDPGGMKPEEYADVIAYLLKLNGFPTGTTDLPTSKEALSLIIMEKP